MQGPLLVCACLPVCLLVFCLGAEPANLHSAWEGEKQLYMITRNQAQEEFS